MARRSQSNGVENQSTKTSWVEVCNLPGLSSRRMENQSTKTSWVEVCNLPGLSSRRVENQSTKTSWAEVCHLPGLSSRRVENQSNKTSWVEVCNLPGRARPKHCKYKFKFSKALLYFGWFWTSSRGYTRKRQRQTDRQRGRQIDREKERQRLCPLYAHTPKNEKRKDRVLTVSKIWGDYKELESRKLPIVSSIQLEWYDLTVSKIRGECRYLIWNSR